jgi:endonuclease G
MKKLFLILTFTFLFALTAFGQTGDQLALGNPSNAKTDLNRPDNYLVIHQGFALSYNKERGAANWVAWHLEQTDVGKAERTNAFAPDTTLPTEWRILPTDYTGSGYDRGHLCPSKDRNDTEYNNQQTFLMSNMQPQAPKLNQQTWKYLEDYTREIVGQGNEAYVYAGCYGDRGKLNNKVTIPTGCFKIVVILPVGDNDLKRINQTTRIIAVDMPNDESVSIRWRTYLTTVDEIERKTGFDFLSGVPKKIQKVIESKKDEESTESQKSETDKTAETKTPTVKTDKSGRQYFLGSRGGCYYLTDWGNKSYVDKKFCSEVKESTSTTEPEVKEIKPAEKPDSKDRTYLKGSRGGCYYINSSGKKTYVDRSLCN